MKKVGKTMACSFRAAVSIFVLTVLSGPTVAGEECDIGFFSGTEGQGDWLSFEYVFGSGDYVGLTCEMSLHVSRQRNGHNTANKAYFYRAIEQDQAFVFHMDFDDVDLSGPQAQELVFFEATRVGAGGAQEPVLQLALAAPNDPSSAQKYWINVYWFENHLASASLQSLPVGYADQGMDFELSWAGDDTDSVTGPGQASVQIKIDGTASSLLNPYAQHDLHSGQYRWGYIDASSMVRNGTALVLQKQF